MNIVELSDDYRSESKVKEEKEKGKKKKKNALLLSGNFSKDTTTGRRKISPRVRLERKNKKNLLLGVSKEVLV